VLGDVEAEGGGLDRILPGGLQDEAGGRAGNAEQHGAADRHEAECHPVVGGGVDREDVGQIEPDLAAGDAREQGDDVLQYQHGDQCDQAEIRPAQPERRDRQHGAGEHGGDGARGDAGRDRPMRVVVEQPCRVGADAGEEARAEIHLAREAEQQVPRHREHREVESQRQ